MGHTIIEKIIGKNIGREVKPGDIVTVNVDRVMIHDIFIPFVKEKFEEMGFTKIWDPDKAVLIYDHLGPASQVDDTRHFRIGPAGRLRPAWHSQRGCRSSVQSPHNPAAGRPAAGRTAPCPAGRHCAG